MAGRAKAASNSRSKAPAKRASSSKAKPKGKKGSKSTTKCRSRSKAAPRSRSTSRARSRSKSRSRSAPKKKVASKATGRGSRVVTRSRSKSVTVSSSYTVTDKKPTGTSKTTKGTSKGTKGTSKGTKRTSKSAARGRTGSVAKTAKKRKSETDQLVEEAEAFCRGANSRQTAKRSTKTSKKASPSPSREAPAGNRSRASSASPSRSRSNDPPSRRRSTSGTSGQGNRSRSRSATRAPVTVAIPRPAAQPNAEVKRRGRPPKSNLPSDDATPTVKTPAVKGRGRPRTRVVGATDAGTLSNHTANAEANEQDSVPPMVASSPTEAMESLPQGEVGISSEEKESTEVGKDRDTDSNMSLRRPSTAATADISPSRPGEGAVLDLGLEELAELQGIEPAGSVTSEENPDAGNYPVTPVGSGSSLDQATEDGEEERMPVIDTDKEDEDDTAE